MNVVIIGNGGHSKVLMEMTIYFKDIQIVGVLDDKFEVCSLKEQIYYGPISSFEFLIEKYKEINFVIAIGNNKIRKKSLRILN